DIGTSRSRNVMATGIPMDDWKRIPWKKVHRNVFRLQQRIYRASSRDDHRTVGKLQRLLLKSKSAKLLAVRQVAQDNQGKRTAGIDGIKSLSPHQRLVLTKHLVVDQKASSVRRLWIPKPGTEEKRQLGIPTMHDRALQTLVKAALEPEWEARFEPNSYGFRPGRCAHDAIKAIYGEIYQKSKWALDADISKCFDQIDRTALLAKLNTSPRLRRCIKGWLEAGVMDGEELFPTTAGTPQGGVITPLTQRKLLIQGQNMAHGNFLCLGVHGHFLHQQADDLSSFSKIQIGQIRFHPLREFGELLDQL